MDGFETAQLIRDTDEMASTPIVFLTGQAAQDSDSQRGYDLGAVDYLVKPVSRQVLYAKVKALLELDQSFARLRREAAKFHEQQLQAARAAEIRQREELAFTQRRERLTNVFAEASTSADGFRRECAHGCDLRPTATPSALSTRLDGGLGCQPVHR